ncbi:MAG: hypothetical protein D6692_01745 [Planctomycetota bacterium]|nr:MAG: hypothetical protein D6692_01745 [Planctomycetota bacterium]
MATARVDNDLMFGALEAYDRDELEALELGLRARVEGLDALSREELERLEAVLSREVEPPREPPQGERTLSPGAAALEEHFARRQHQFKEGLKLPERGSMLDEMVRTGLRVVPAAGGVIVGAPAGPLGMAGLGAAGAGLGEAAAQAYEYLQGERTEPNVTASAVAAATGALAPITGGVGATPARTVLRQVGTGAALGAASGAAFERAEGGSGLAGALFGGFLGALGGALAAREVSAAQREWYFEQARKLGFRGKTWADLRDWYEEQLVERARRVVAAEQGAAEQSAASPAPDSQPPVRSVDEASPTPGREMTPPVVDADAGLRTVPEAPEVATPAESRAMLPAQPPAPARIPAPPVDADAGLRTLTEVPEVATPVDEALAARPEREQPPASAEERPARETVAEVQTTAGELPVQVANGDAPPGGTVLQTTPAADRKVSQLVDRKQFRVQKAFVLEAVEQALRAAPEAVASPDDRVTIEVPGDGTFTVPNSKPALKRFGEAIAKRWGQRFEVGKRGEKKVTVSSPFGNVSPPPRSGGKSTLSPVARKRPAGKKVVEVAKLALRVKPSSRIDWEFKEPWQDGAFTVATDKAYLFAASGGAAKPWGQHVTGASGAGVTLDKLLPAWLRLEPSGKVSVERRAKAYKGWTPMEVSTADLERWATQADLSQAPDTPAKLMLLHERGGKLAGVSTPDTSKQGGGAYVSEGVRPGEPARALVDAAYMRVLAQQARKLGAEKVTLHLPPSRDEMVITTGSDFVAAVAPLQLPDGAAPAAPDIGQGQTARASRSGGGSTAAMAALGGEALPGPGAQERVTAPARAAAQSAEPPQAAVSGDVEESMGFALHAESGAPLAIHTDTDVPVEFAQLDKLQPAEMPELVWLVKELTGDVPFMRSYPRALGMFYGSGSGKIGLHPRVFADPAVAVRVLAHEIGHLVDYLPQRTLKRGNLLGRLATLREFLQTTFPVRPGDEALGGPVRAEERRRLRRQADQAFPRDREAAAQRYRELLARLIEERGLTTEQRVREELVALSDWWRPFLGREGVPAKYLRYRQSGKELYADFLSVVLVDPASAKAMAPTAWAMFWSRLDAKPQVKAALFEMHELLHAPREGFAKKHAARRARTMAAFARGDEMYLRMVEQRHRLRDSWQGFLQRVKQELVDIYSPIVDRARPLARAGNDAAAAVMRVFDEHPLAMDSRVYLMTQAFWEQVVKPVEAAGLTLHDLGEVLLHRRIVHDVEGRAQMANPQGHTPETSAAQLEYLRQRHGPERWAVIEAAEEAFHNQVWGAVQEAVEVGTYSRAAAERWAKDERRTYATFQVLEYMYDWVPASMRPQKGTLKDIGNPVLFTYLKLASILRLNQLQRAKWTAISFLQEYFPHEIQPARMMGSGPGARAAPNPDPAGGVLEALQDGQPVGFWVPRDVARAFEGVTPAHASAIVQLISWPWRKIFYPLFITFNPAFQLATGPLRDIRRTNRNVGFREGARQLGEYLANLGTLSVEAVNALTAGLLPPLPVPMTQAARDARDYLAGRPNPLVREMMLNGAIGTPLDSFVKGASKNDAINELARRFRLLPEAERRQFLLAHALQPARKLLRSVEYAGLTMEMIPKMSVYRSKTQKDGLPPSEVAAVVRNLVGVPNFRRQGRSTRFVNTIFPFFNVFAQGLLADAERARSRKSAAGWWFRWAAGSGILRLLAAAGAAGWLGKELKELYDYESEYNKTNYLVVPLGWQDGGEVTGKRLVRIRIPEDETDRLLGGILHKSVQLMAGKEGAKWQQLLGFAGGQVPGINPAIDIPLKWGEYLAGRNPVDSFRGNHVLTNTEYLAGGWAAMGKMLRWTYNQTGVQNWVRWDPEAKTVMEMTVSALPGVNRLIGVTDRGVRELIDAQKEGEAAGRAKIRVRLPKEVQSLYGEYQFLRSAGKFRSELQEQRWQQLRIWYNNVYSPLFEALELNDEGGEKVAFASNVEVLRRLSEPFTRR